MVKKGFIPDYDGAIYPSYEAPSVLSGGKINKITRQTAIANKNGIVPLNIVHKVPLWTAPLITNTTKPTGGIIWPISTVTTVSTSTQTASKPGELVTGNVKGSIY